MIAKTIIVLCAQALLVQTAFSQCLGRGIDYVDRIAAPCGLAGAGWANDGLANNGLAGAGFGWGGNTLAYGGAYDGAYGIAGIANAPGIAPASGGALPVSSASRIAPTGISVASENAIEGILAVTGDLPFVSAVALEGALPTTGAGSVVYGCGNGNIGIVSDGIGADAALADGFTYGPVNGLAAARGYGGFAAPGLGGTAFSQCLGRGIDYVDRIAAPCGLAGAGWANDGLAYNGLAGAGLGWAGNGLAYDGVYGGAYGGAYGMAGVANAPGIAPASGGALPISSASPIAPNGISVASENAIEGILAVTGDLPFVSAVALEGALPTAGAGSVAYGCGNGNIGIVSEGIGAGAALTDGFAYGSGFTGARGIGGIAAPAFGAVRGFGGLAAPAFGGCGCSSIY